MAGKPTEPVDVTGAMIEGPVALGDWLVVAPVALCLSVAALLLMIRKDVGRQVGLAVAGLVALVAIDAALLLRVIENGPVTMVMGRWLPPFGIAFTVDALGAAFTLAAGLAALAGGVYALVDVDQREMRYGFWSFLFLMVGGVSGAFLTGDIFNLYVWFEVLLIASFGLLVLGSTTEQIDGATKYAFLNLVATTLFLVGTAFLYGLTGTLNMADMAVKLPLVAAGGAAPLVTIGALYLLAFGMKAAAFPVNFWLPASYHTPHVVVSALFAGLLTKVGIYALLRTLLLIMPAARLELGTVIAGLAIATMVTGALGALAQSDARRAMGYLVVSGIGVMLAGLALATPLGVAGTVLYALHSIVVMTALYMATGLAGRLAGSFSLHDMRGLYRRSALLAALFLVLLFAVSGLPPFTGFWPKAMLVRASVDAGAGWLAGAILLNGFLTTIFAGRIFALGFWRPAPAVAGEGDGPGGALAGGSAPNDGRAPNDGQFPNDGRNDGAPAALDPPAEPLGARALLPVAALTGLVVVLGLYPEPLVATARAAADGLIDPAAYLNSVFPDAGPVAGEAAPGPGGARPGDANGGAG